MSELSQKLRDAFKRKRYGKGEYDPDFDLFDVAADEVDRLRSALADAGLHFALIVEAAKSVDNPKFAESVSKFMAQVANALGASK